MAQAQDTTARIDSIVSRHLADLPEALEVVVSDDGRFSATVIGVWPHFATEAEARQEITRWIAGYIMNGQGVRSYNRDAAGYSQIMQAYRQYATPTTETCALCGDARDMFCSMSADGEGPHQIVTAQSISAADAALLERMAVHAEQGAAER